MSALALCGASIMLATPSPSPHLTFPGLTSSPNAVRVSPTGRNCRMHICVCSVGAMRKPHIEEEDDDDDGWEAQLLAEISPLPQRRRPVISPKPDIRKGKGEEQEWAVRARTLGFQKLQDRNFSSQDLDRLLLRNQTKKSKSRVAKASHGTKKTVQEHNSFEESCMVGLGLGHGDLKTALLSDVRFDSKEEQWREESALHRALIKAGDPQELLKLISSQNPKILTAKNVATALHRLARHMESLSSSESERLIIARQRETCRLVSLAVEILPECSAQGLSNIAWALSKIGGRLLYEAEMDALAEAVIHKVDQFNAQNVANTAGAFASMQHSAPAVFEELASRAGCVAQCFKTQELAQVIWSFASLNHPLGPLLDSLDTISDSEILRPGHGYDPREDGGGSFLQKFSLEQLANIAWSFTVLGELQRPFCTLILSTVSSIVSEVEGGVDSLSMQLLQQQRLLGQLHQVFTCLKLEYSGFPFSINKSLEELAQRVWEEDKRACRTTSVLQKNLQYLLGSTGRNWVYEYLGAEYSLDAALVEEKLAIEVDGPSHFFRNSGLPLGHTVLKRRLLKASGWNLVSLSYQQWESVEGEVQQKRLLQKLLEGYL